MRGTLARKKGSRLAKAKSAKPAPKAKTKKIEKKTEKVEKKPARRSRRDEQEDEDEPRGRFAPPPKKDSTPTIIAVIGALVLVVVIAFAAGGSGSSLVDEHEAERAYNLVDGQYKLAKGGDALAENRGALRAAFQKVADTFPGTEAANSALQRVRELQ